MKSGALIGILQLLCLIVLLFSLYFESDVLLIIAAVITALCVVLSFFREAKRK